MSAGIEGVLNVLGYSIDVDVGIVKDIYVVFEFASITVEEALLDKLAGSPLTI